METILTLNNVDSPIKLLIYHSEDFILTCKLELTYTKVNEVYRVLYKCAVQINSESILLKIQFLEKQWISMHP